MTHDEFDNLKVGDVLRSTNPKSWKRNRTVLEKTKDEIMLEKLKRRRKSDTGNLVTYDRWQAIAKFKLYKNGNGHHPQAGQVMMGLAEKFVPDLAKDRDAVEKKEVPAPRSPCDPRQHSLNYGHGMAGGEFGDVIHYQCAKCRYWIPR